MKTNNTKYQISKKEIIETGNTINAVMEILQASGITDLSDFSKLHKKCSDFEDHPDWKKYSIIIEHCQNIIAGNEIDWRMLYTKIHNI